MESAKCGGLIRQPPADNLYVWWGENIVHTISNNGEIYDVGSSYPGGEEAPKGLAVRQLKRYVSWVQTVGKSCLLLDSLAAPDSDIGMNKSTHIGGVLIDIQPVVC